MRKIFGMSANVADAVRNTRNTRVHAPVRNGSISLLLQCGDRVALRILGNNFKDAAQFPLLHHRAGFLDHRIASVVVSQGEYQSALLHHIT